MLPFGERALKNREPTFEIPLDRGTPTTGILRLQTQGSLQFPLTLWDAHTYATHIADQQFYYGLYYGVFVVLALLACITFRFTRDATFLFLMADAVADWQAAAELGDRLPKRIASLRFDGDRAFSITASLGIALALPKPGIVAEELIQRADKALYRAKRDGRNRAVFAPDPCRPRAAHVVPLRS